MPEELNFDERFLLLTDPQAFAVLVLAETPRPWTAEAIEDAKVTARMLPEDQAQDAFTLGLSLINRLALLPEGLDYPATPLSRLDPDQAQQWMQKYADAAQRQMRPKGKVLELFSGKTIRITSIFVPIAKGPV